MRHLTLLPILTLSIALAGALPPSAGADSRPGIDLCTGRLRPDSAGLGAPFTVFSAGNPGTSSTADSSQGRRSFVSTSSDYAYRGGTLLDPKDYIVAFFYTYNYSLTSRVYLTAGVGLDYAAYSGEKRVIGAARTVGASYRFATTESMAVSGQVRWTKYTTPGEHLGGLTPMIHFRWQPGR